MSGPGVTTRCRYSHFGMERLRRRKPNREGDLIRFNWRGNPVVRWDGLKSTNTYHPDFIEIISATGPQSGEHVSRSIIEKPR